MSNGKKASSKPAIFELFVSGIKKNYKAAFILQGLALVIVFAYYLLPGFSDLLNRLGSAKERFGYLYSALSTMVFGGLIPFLIILGSGQIEKKDRLRHLLFYLSFWIWKGVEVDMLYRFQGILFGTEISFRIVLKKMLLDQFVYCPLWAAPTMTLFYLWKDRGFSIENMKPATREVSLFYRILSVLIPNMIVWVPAVCIIYSLPANLQLPLFNLVICFWALILKFVVEGKKE